MQRFFTILAEGVERLEGFGDKFTGDGIMALIVNGRGPALGMPALPLSPRVRAQLRVGAAAEARWWEASFSALLPASTPAEALKAKSD